MGAVAPPEQHSAAEAPGGGRRRSNGGRFPPAPARGTPSGESGSSAPRVIGMPGRMQPTARGQWCTVQQAREGEDGPKQRHRHRAATRAPHRASLRLVMLASGGLPVVTPRACAQRAHDSAPGRRSDVS